VSEIDRDDLVQLHRAVDEELRTAWDRSLSFQDGTFDRWERARRLGFGEGASIYDSAAVFGNVTVGANSWIGPNTLLDGSGGGLHIGEWCCISAGVQIYTHDTVLRSLSGGAVERATAGPTSVGDCSYLGPVSVVRAGVVIGSMCVVATGSFVNRDVPDRTVVGGSPAKVLGRVVGEGTDVALEFDRSSRD
jgi:acetyltransferase-like isoleucine patch superfamily enzyme